MIASLCQGMVRDTLISQKKSLHLKGALYSQTPQVISSPPQDKPKDNQVPPMLSLIPQICFPTLKSIKIFD